MKKSGKFLAVFLMIGVLTMLNRTPAFASLEINPEQAGLAHNFSVTGDASYIKYEEPDIMEETGWMAGVSGNYDLRFPRHFVLGVDGRFAYSQVNYDSTSTGSVDDIDDFIMEVRGTAGYDLYPSGAIRLTPYTGFGYRFLRDNLGGKTSTTGALGYDRESNYFYVPIGLKSLAKMNEDWFWGATIEYDIFIDGTQRSELGDAVAGLDTLENDQNDGYGIRGSVQLIKQGEKFNFLAEPYIRYWNIDQSDTKAVTFGGTPIGVVGYEPDNESTEIGLKLGLAY